MPIDARFDLPPQEAIAFLEQKGIRVSWAWQDVWAQEHEAAFTVAKMADTDLLAEVKRAALRALEDGTTLQAFKNALIPSMEAAGWWGVVDQVDPLTGETRAVQLGSARRLQTIYRTNMSMAYSAGDWAKIEETADDAPFLMYDAVDDNLTRPQHAAWDGITLRWDHPFWKTHRGPNDYNCRCGTIQLDWDDLRRIGKSGPDEAPEVVMREWTNKRTGEVMQLPVGVGPGFDYNPGEGRVAELRHALAGKQAAFEAGR